MKDIIEPADWRTFARPSISSRISDAPWWQARVDPALVNGSALQHSGEHFADRTELSLAVQLVLPHPVQRRAFLGEHELLLLEASIEE